VEQTLRILHLEDDPLDTELVRGQLQKAGLAVQIERADTLEGFRRALGCGRYEIVLSDFAMPRLDPMEAIRLAKQHCPELPFIFLSGTLGEEQAIETLKLGATDYVLKQRAERLVPAIRRALHEAEELSRRKHAEEALRESEERFRTLADNIAQLAWMTDEKGSIVWYNQRWFEYTGSTFEQTKGEMWSGLLHPDD